MIKLVNFCALFFSILILSACATASIQSQAAPEANLTKDDALYIVEPKNSDIPHQKYYAALKNVLQDQGFNLVHTKSAAKYLMTVTFNDFQADLYESVPDVQTTVSHGNIGSTPVNATSTTYANQTVHRKIPTHNSSLKVTDANTGRAVWQASLAKSFDVYNHQSLEKMIAKMLSLYGKDGKTTQMIEDEFRW